MQGRNTLAACELDKWQWELRVTQLWAKQVPSFLFCDASCILTRRLPSISFQICPSMVPVASKNFGKGVRAQERAVVWITFRRHRAAEKHVSDTERSRVAWSLPVERSRVARHFRSRIVVEYRNPSSHKFGQVVFGRKLENAFCSEIKEGRRSEDPSPRRDQSRGRRLVVHGMMWR